MSENALEEPVLARLLQSFLRRGVRSLTILLHRVWQTVLPAHPKRRTHFAFGTWAPIPGSFLPRIRHGSKKRPPNATPPNHTCALEPGQGLESSASLRSRHSRNNTGSATAGGPCSNPILRRAIIGWSEPQCGTPPDRRNKLVPQPFENPKFWRWECLKSAVDSNPPLETMNSGFEP